MKISDEDFALFKAHLVKHQKKLLVCPICESTDWGLDGPMHLATYYESRLGRSTVGVMICNTCGYMRHINWDAIKGEVQGG